MLRGKVSLPRGSHSPTNCGPETLAAALTYIGIHAPIEDVEREIYNPAIKGAVAPQIVDYARRKGAKAKITEGSGLWKLRNYIESDLPILIEVTRGGLYHYYLVVGMSPEADRVVVCAWYGEEQDLLSFELLDDLWKPTRFRSITFSVSGAEERTKDGYDFLDAGKLDLAKREFQEALKLQPDYPPALAGMGEVRLLQNRLQEALEYLERAHKSLPGESRLLNNLAHALLESPKLDAARAEKLSEDAVAAALRQLGEFEEELKTAAPGTKDRIQSDIDDLRFRLFYYYGTWGQALEANGKRSRSVEERERSLGFAPAEDPDGVARRHWETGNALKAGGDSARALEHFRKGRAIAADEGMRGKLDEAIKSAGG
jgi:tetratricopeptide (TPR) repeat protein